MSKFIPHLLRPKNEKLKKNFATCLMNNSEIVSKTRDYYDSDNMLNFHDVIYGEHIHIGIYKTESESIAEANLRTLETINGLLELNSSSHILDIGSGYGGAARYLVKKITCNVDCFNLSVAQNEINRELNQQLGIDNKIRVFDSSFQEIPFPDETYDTVLCQDALLYSNDRLQVFQEVFRVLQNGGQFLLTDVMLSDRCPAEVVQKTVDMVGIKSLASVETYQAIARETGFEVIQIQEMPEQVTQQYQKTLDSLNIGFDELLKFCAREFLEYQKMRLSNWIAIGNQGYLNWGILHFRKK